MKNIFSSDKTGLAVISLIIFIGFTIWWLVLNMASYDDSAKQLWAALYQVLALLGAITGIIYSKKWGGYKSVIGRGILALSIGLLLQSFGQSTYSYYIFFQQIDVPYPSVGDIGFFGSVIAYLYGVICLAKAAGVGFRLKSAGHKFGALLIPVVMLVASYLFFLQGYEFDGSSLKTFLDFGYPFGQAVYVSLAILTYLYSRRLLGGIMRAPIMFLVGALIFQYIADFTFLYQASRGLWHVGGINDLLYAASYFLMTLGLIYIGRTYYHIRETQ